jgi:hypothetical protein
LPKIIGLNIVARQQAVNNLPVLVLTGGLLVALQYLTVTTKNFSSERRKVFLSSLSIVCAGK